MPAPTPFEVTWSAAEVEPVLAQVRGYPWPPVPDVPDGWALGCDAGYLKDLCAFWTERYDWRAAVAQLNRFPQFTARIEDVDLHFVHLVGEAQGRRPLLLTHGWPGSHYEFWGVAEKLAFPSRFGGEARDAFDLVIPSLPGYGFSSRPRTIIGQRATARLFAMLMTDALGYSRFLAQGGDWGGIVTSWLGVDHAAHVRGIHLNMLGLTPGTDPNIPEEADWLGRQRKALDRLGAYQRLQNTRPQSLAWMAAGNPVGQAAWIAERFHDWADLRGRSLDEVFAKAELLTNIMIYVMTGSFTTAVWYYRGLAQETRGRFEPGQRCEVPTGFAAFPEDAIGRAPPRSLMQRGYNLIHWTDMPRGGHFAAMEEPDLLVDDVRAWARMVEQQG
jgi:microsomal epoxide hydrolase